MSRDARRAGRALLGAKAWIRFDDGFSVRACRVMDLSSRGVRLMVEAPHDVADQFRLLLTRSAAPGTRCRITWRKGSEIGAEFVDSRG